MNSKYNKEVIQKVKDLVIEGKNDKEISIILNISRDSCKNIRRYYKIASPWASCALSKRQQITNLHSKGLNMSEIARGLNISTSSVEQYFKKLKLKSPWTRRSYINELDRLKGYMIRNLKFSAKRRNLNFNLEYTDIQLPINCPILNVPLAYESNFNNHSYPTIDRIDNSKGYIKGNIIVISRLANTMKNCATNEQLKTFCNNIIKLIENQGALGDITDIFPETILKT